VQRTRKRSKEFLSVAETPVGVNNPDQSSVKFFARPARLRSTPSIETLGPARSPF
jgi:hypothetical protein